ncbi:signal peptidase II [Oceanobacillus profundus]|mgnify:CR=1 FL=1|uniref:Lipoprotein signal peptidase n=1 Tax=Oceanobacillus profundus TaxID=372463 RepID=A0A417YKS2_9BACI|nr:signal peptidase II [Oceanobacillus profundus]MBR3119466.1 signal peptidase II [Oceanobacillus sp.]MDO6449724.1 signal peptidase II [Oceanobacillus profundus]PAE30103.1 signal peptidase II [Paenibacillus sp. 7884-2]RHW33726.1 lipoprotein signal peptidase [Oceanobacillus profundus]
MIWYYVIALFIIGIDQLTKWIIVSTMELGERITVIENFFYITSHRNSGAAWGILQGQMLFFYIVTAVVVIGIIYYMQKFAKNDTLLAIGLSFVLGGAIGNFIDRLFHQEVVDFADFYIFNYNFPIFNVADSALTIGVIIVIIATIMDERKKGKAKK